MRTHAEVIWFDMRKGFGFLRIPGGQEVFAHWRNLRRGEVPLLPHPATGELRLGLKPGDWVECEVTRSGQGKSGLQAMNVRVEGKR